MHNNATAFEAADEYGKPEIAAWIALALSDPFPDPDDDTDDELPLVKRGSSLGSDTGTRDDSDRS